MIDVHATTISKDSGNVEYCEIMRNMIMRQLHVLVASCQSLQNISLKSVNLKCVNERVSEKIGHIDQIALQDLFVKNNMLQNILCRLFY